LSERVKSEPAEDCATQVSKAFAIALQREPAPDEAKSCRHFLEEHSLRELAAR
jgi:hypothetical protein